MEDVEKMQREMREEKEREKKTDPAPGEVSALDNAREQLGIAMNDMDMKHPNWRMADVRAGIGKGLALIAIAEALEKLASDKNISVDLKVDAKSILDGFGELTKE